MSRPAKRERKALFDEHLGEASAKQHRLPWSHREQPLQQPQEQTGEQERDNAVEQQPLQHLPAVPQQTEDAIKVEVELPATQDSFFDQMSEGSSFLAEEEAHVPLDAALPERLPSDAGSDGNYHAGAQDSTGI